MNAARPGGTTEGSVSDAASSAGRRRGVAGGVQTSDTVPAASPGEALRGKDARLGLGGGDGGGSSSSPRTARAWRSIAPSANVASAKDSAGRVERTPRGGSVKEDGCLKLHAHGAVVSYKFGVTQVDELKWDAWRRNMTAAEREAEKNKSKEQRDAEKAARRAKEQAEKARRDVAKARREADAKVKKAKEEADARVKKEKEAKAKRAKEVKSQRG